MLSLLLGVGGATACTLAAIYIFYPGAFFIALVSLTRMAAGVRRKSARVGPVTWVYSERGQPVPGVSSVVMVHGFSAARDSWNLTIRKLPTSLHIVAVDLPGHGDTEADPSEKMHKPYDYYVSNLHKFLQTIGLGERPVHVVGLSMGGCIVGLYSANYPSHVDRVSMLCPGMETPSKSKMTLDREANPATKPLLPETADEQRQTIKYATHKQFKFPKQLLRGMVDLRRKYIPFFNMLMGQLMREDNRGLLNKAMGKITVPAHVMWGEEDGIIHVSGANVLKAGIPNVKQCDIIPRCGHAIDLEKPNHVAERLMQFRSS